MFHKVILLATGFEISFSSSGTKWMIVEKIKCIKNVFKEIFNGDRINVIKINSIIWLSITYSLEVSSVY